VKYHRQAYPIRRLNGRYALALGGLGGGGLGHALVHLFIWRLLFRGGLAIWRVPIFGPAIDIVLGLAIVALMVIRSQRGPGWWQRRRGPSGTGTGGTGSGSRDW
jgi:hypothetical protein